MPVTEETFVIYTKWSQQQITKKNILRQEYPPPLPKNIPTDIGNVFMQYLIIIYDSYSYATCKVPGTQQHYHAGHYSCQCSDWCQGQGSQCWCQNRNLKSDKIRTKLNLGI